jgi:hypothetical protein
MDDYDESRVIYNDNGALIVEAMISADHEITAPDGDCYSEEDHAAFRSGEWGYVNLWVQVTHNGTVIGTASLGGVDHGQLAEVTADAFEWEPAVVDGKTTTMGSPLWGVASEAVNEAWWLTQRLTGGVTASPNAPIRRVLRWALPIDRQEVEKAHAEALVENVGRVRFRPVCGG